MLTLDDLAGFGIFGGFGLGFVVRDLVDRWRRRREAQRAADLVGLANEPGRVVSYRPPRMETEWHTLRAEGLGLVGDMLAEGWQLAQLGRGEREGQGGQAEPRPAPWVALLYRVRPARARLPLQAAEARQPAPVDAQTAQLRRVLLARLAERCTCGAGGSPTRASHDEGCGALLEWCASDPDNLLDHHLYTGGPMTPNSPPSDVR